MVGGVVGGCGGCDLQHADLTTQRELKRQVVAEQLRRLGGYDWTGEVESVPPSSGFGWRPAISVINPTRPRNAISPVPMANQDHQFGDVASTYVQ